MTKIASRGPAFDVRLFLFDWFYGFKGNDQASKIKALAWALPVEATSNWEADFVFFSETGADKDIRNVNHTVQDVNNEVKDLVGAPSHPKFLWYLYYILYFINLKQRVHALCHIILSRVFFLTIDLPGRETQRKRNQLVRSFCQLNFLPEGSGFLFS